MQKTAYVGDDGDDVIRAMFVADKPGDLGAGTLYAAKWVQQSGDDFGKADLQWIRLGHATEAEIKALIDKGTKFSDIFEVADAKDVQADPAKYQGFKPTFIYPGTGGGKAKLEYLRVKPGMEQAAAFLETRRYAATLGATTEFTKMEGQAHNAADKKLYTVISYVRDGMIDGKNGDRPQDDIRLAGDAKDLTCGVVYREQLEGRREGYLGRADRQRLGGHRHLRPGHRRPQAGRTDRRQVRQVRHREGRQSRQHQVFRGDAHAVHRRGFRQPPQ